MPDTEPTRYAAIATDLRRQIESGELRLGDRLPSYAAMRAQGVSQNTMEKAHALLEREGLLVRRHRLGLYVAEPGAKASAPIAPDAGPVFAEAPVVHGRAIGVCGVGFDFTAYPAYWGALLAGIRRGAAAAGREVLLLESNAPESWSQAAGLLVCDPAGQLLPRVPAGLPCVALLARAREHTAVTADDYHGVRLAVEHLVALGHRDIALLHAAVNPQVASRINGYRDGLTAAGIAPQERWRRRLESAGDGFANGHAAMRAWLDDGFAKLGCTALLAQSDPVAAGAIAALHEAGIAVPGQMSVVGFDGADLTRVPILTTIHVPLMTLGLNAVDLLLRQPETRGAEHVVVPVTLHLGTTTAPRT